MRASQLLLSTFLLSAIASQTVANTFVVPQDAPTIQQGIDLCAEGDTVLVAPGIYSDCEHNYGGRNFCFLLQDGVTVRGQTGNPEDVVIDAMQLGSPVCAFEVQDCRLEGMTLTGGSATALWNGSGGGLYCQFSSISIHSCVFDDNGSPDHAGGIMAHDSTIIMANCVVRNNDASTSGGGAYFSGCQFEVDGCTFEDNNCSRTSEQFPGGGGLFLDASQGYILSSLFLNNTCPNASAGALGIYTGSTGNIYSCRFEGNSALNAGAVSVWESATPIGFVHTSFIQNSAVNNGGAVVIEYAGSAILNFCLFQDNVGPVGLDLFLDENSTANTQCTIYDENGIEGPGQVNIMSEDCLPNFEVVDVPDDQGGNLNVQWDDLNSHVPGQAFQIEAYEVQVLDNEWATILSVPDGEPTYSAVIETQNVLIEGQDPPIAEYRIAGVTDSAEIVLTSSSVSAYSIDNLPPPPPELDFIQADDAWVLLWDLPAIPDNEETCIYRSFVPGSWPEEPRSCLDLPPYIETAMNNAVFRARHRDIHGNWSDYSEEAGPGNLTNVPGLVGGPIQLRQNVPNPFNPSTKITYFLPEDQAVSLKIFDTSGKLVRSLINGELQVKGENSEMWDGRDRQGRQVAAGAYFYQLRAGERVLTKRMLLLK